MNNRKEGDMKTEFIDTGSLAYTAHHSFQIFQYVQTCLHKMNESSFRKKLTWCLAYIYFNISQ